MFPVKSRLAGVVLALTIAALGAAGIAGNESCGETAAAATPAVAQVAASR